MTGTAVADNPVVALTGATGFIGTALRERLVAAGYGVRALYRPGRQQVLPSSPGLAWIPGDIADPASLKALLEGAMAVVHCAGAVRGARRADFDRVNESGVRNVITAAVDQPRCERFLLLSSLAARMPHLSDYAGSKRRGELALAAGAGRLDWSVLRPPAVYGPGDREMLPLFRSMARGWAPIPGDGHGRFSLIYVADLAAAIVAWLAADRGRGETYELDDGHSGGYAWAEVLTVASRVLRDCRPIHRLPLPAPLLRLVGWSNLAAARALGYAPMLTPGKVRELTHDDWVCDGRDFEQTTGWRPEFGFERGLMSTLGKSTATLNELS